MDFPALAAADGSRFSAQRGRLWKGASGEASWTWTADLGKPTAVGAILQVIGDEESVATGAPMTYVWQISDDGKSWNDVDGAGVVGDRRMYRVHRMPKPRTARYWRLAIEDSSDEPPAIREVEFYADSAAEIEFPHWLLVVSSHHLPSLATCHRYLDLARKCEGWGDVTAQFLWHEHLDPEFVDVEPRPLCLFFGGSNLEWCQVDRSGWKGVGALLREAKYPIWGACGGGQVFGLLEEYGAGVPWDCPKCRDPQNPKSPIYGHIGAIDPARTTPCSVYTNNIYEIGPTPVQRVGDDPVFVGLPKEFLIPEYHCGQLEHLPKGWDLVATKGEGGKTWMQCMRKRGACIYGAQFHIEHQGTPEASRTIMANFLREAVAWNARHQAGSNRAVAKDPGDAKSDSRISAVADSP